MLRPHRHFKCCPLTFDCFLARAKACGNSDGHGATFCCSKHRKQSTKNGKFNELARVPMGLRMDWYEMFADSTIFSCFFSFCFLLLAFGFLFCFLFLGQNYFQQICQIKFHVEEAASDSLQLESHPLKGPSLAAA